MSDLLYYLISAILVLLVLLGIYLLSKAKTAKLGNFISGLSLFAAVVVTFIKFNLFSNWLLYVFIIVGAVIGIILAYRIEMIKMPQFIAALNGLGGLSSLIVGAFAVYKIGSDNSYFSQTSALLALVIGTITFVGSLIAFLKLGNYINPKPVKVFKYSLFIIAILILLTALVFSGYFINISWLVVLIGLVLSIVFAVIFTISIGGADMPITISLLNSFSGLAAAISGLAISDLLLVAYGGIVGASGLILTQIMCKAMNKRLVDILMGKTTSQVSTRKEIAVNLESDATKANPRDIFINSKDVIIVPGYGMAIAQAQKLTKELADIIKDNGGKVRFAIHPVAGRMPGHMNVLLAEVNVDYDDLYDLADINSDFSSCDLAIVIGANDVINPAAKTHEGTPIYGMPILDVSLAKNIFIFNYDLKPGYSGVENPLYSPKDNVYLFLGDAQKTLSSFINSL